MRIAIFLLAAMPAFGQYVMSGQYNPGGTLANPTFSPGAGTYSSTQTVTITYPGGSTGCYATSSISQGAVAGTCGSGWTTYTTTVSVSATSTLYAYATEVGWTNSGTASAAYTINSGAAFVNNTTGVILASAGNVTSSSFSATAGNTIFAFVATNSLYTGCNCSSYTWTVSGTAGSGTDTFTQMTSLPSFSNGYVASGNYMCATAFYAVVGAGHGGSAYTVTAAISGGSFMGMAVAQFSGIAGTLDKTCDGIPNSGTTVACSGSMTPTGGPEVIVAGMGDYTYTDTPSNGSGYTIPSGGTASASGKGVYSLEYQLCQSSCGSAYTPSFGITSLSSDAAIIGAAFK
jgi:hypothetical protein